MLSVPIKRPRLSIVVVFFNMTREAPRTLFSLSTAYQRDVGSADYEVIAIDSGSDQPIDTGQLAELPGQFRYRYIKPSAPTPCEAMNAGIRMARGRYVACAIDGARMVSPGMIEQTLRALAAYPNALVCSMGMHLGPKRQTLSVSEGYCQAVEDRLLESSGWRDNGYKLFEISVPAGSSQGGFLRPMAESNFFTVARRFLLEIGGFDERFKSPGGGLVNLDIHKRLMTRSDIQPVMLLGEASFHQFHGGVSTNVPASAHPLQAFKAEYRQLRGEEYSRSDRAPIYFGHIPEATRAFLDCATSAE